ncbi:MAG: hypothetical protein ACK2UH_07000, partial [Candidatus Promineifilaceae bacterium]
SQNRGSKMNQETVAGIALISGTALTYLGFGIFPSRIYTVRDIAIKLELVQTYPRRWSASQIGVILGAVASAIGFLLLAPLFQGTDGANLILFGVVAFLLGHILWIWHLILRIGDPPSFATAKLPSWHFTLYALLAPLGLLICGVSFWLLGAYNWLAIGLVVASLIYLAIMAIYRDIPPFLFYLLTLIIGMVLLI